MNFWKFVDKSSVFTYNGDMEEPVLINRLSTLMGQRRVSIQDVTRATGLNYSTVFQLYHDKSTRFDRDTLNRLCNYFGVGLGELFEWVPDSTSEDNTQT